MCEVMPDGDVSVRELRNHTAEVLRRVEAGERVRITVDRRPMAELGVHMTATRVALPIDDGVAVRGAATQGPGRPDRRRTTSRSIRRTRTSRVCPASRPSACDLALEAHGPDQRKRAS